MMVMADGIGYVGRRALAQVGRLLLLALLLLNGPDIVGATRHLFSVHDDLLGFPQVCRGFCFGEGVLQFFF